MKKFLPIGVQDFAQMIDGNFVYVDKTRYVYEIARVPQAFYFFSRPRRFGKSLLVSTLKSLFAGRKDLFKNLWIEKSDWPWKPHPIVNVDFNGVDATDAKILEKSLSITLDEMAELHQLTLKHDVLTSKFAKLIIELNKKHREKIVVLIDEYDKPIITHLGKGEAGLQVARENRDLLKKFFGVLKEAQVSSSLRFVFITGISKFSKVGIFSDLNNLEDLSMQSDYAEVAGYTGDEISRYFADYIPALAEENALSYDGCLEQLRTWYNGHRFTKKDIKIYNPFSILNALKSRAFRNFWFETGTPSFLVNLIKEKDYPIPHLENLEIQEAAFSTYELENLQLEALLFQTGYLTIHEYDGVLYRLGYPDQEVKNSFLSYLYQSLVEVPDTTLKAQYVRLHQYLEREDIDQFIATVNAILSAIPYPHIHGQDERYYHTVFYLMLSASGVLVRTEVLTAHGRMDLAVEFKDKVYIVELKCNQAAEQAIQQIHQRRYYEKYLQSGRKICLLGINFDIRERGVKDWRFETLAG